VREELVTRAPNVGSLENRAAGPTIGYLVWQQMGLKGLVEATVKKLSKQRVG